MRQLPCFAGYPDILVLRKCLSNRQVGIADAEPRPKPRRELPVRATEDLEEPETERDTSRRIGRVLCGGVACRPRSDGSDAAPLFLTADESDSWDYSGRALRMDSTGAPPGDSAVNLLVFTSYIRTRRVKVKEIVMVA